MAAAATVACSDGPTSAPVTRRLPSAPNAALGPKPSDGHIAYASTALGGSDIYVLDHVAGVTRRVTFSWTGSEPAISPDGKRIAFRRTQDFRTVSRGQSR